MFGDEVSGHTAVVIIVFRDIIDHGVCQAFLY